MKTLKKQSILSLGICIPMYSAIDVAALNQIIITILS